MSTKKLPKANRKLSSRITPNNIEQKENNRIVFSFQALNRNDYFNLDGTCTNWSSDFGNLQMLCTACNIKKSAHDVAYKPWDTSIYEDFEQFCKDMGMSKTGATENAIRMYMDKMKKAVKTIK